jgi:hypothetical protein
MSLSFKNYRSLSTDPQNSLFNEIVRNLSVLQTSFNNNSAPGLTEKKLIGYPSYDFLIFASCGFDFGYVKPAKHKFYTVREPDGDKLKVWYEFNHRTNQLYDKSCFGNHGQLEGHPKITLLKDLLNPTYALQFDGVNDSVSIPNSADMDTLSEFSWSFWLYPTAFTAGSGTILEKSIWANGAYTVYTSASPGNRFTFEAQNDTGTRHLVDDGGYFNTTGVNRYYYIVVTYDGANLRIYVDGSLKGTTAHTGTHTRNASYTLGGATADFAGYMYEACFYNRALTQAEITNGLIGITSLKGLVARWGFDEGTGTTARDSINYHTGTISGAVYSQTQKPSWASNTQIFDNGVWGSIAGYIMDGATDIRIPERTDDTRITGKLTGWSMYAEIKATDFSLDSNGHRQRLAEKYDDDTKTYGYSWQIGSDGSVYFFVRWNGADKKIKLATPLVPGYYYQLWVTANIAQAGNADVTQFLKMGVNGFIASAPSTADDPDNSLAVTDTDLVVGASPLDNTSSGYCLQEMYAFRYYDEEVETAAQMLGQYTTKLTTYQNPWSHCFVLNQSLIQESSTKIRLWNEYILATAISDSWAYNVITKFKTRRWSETVAVSDDWTARKIAPFSIKSASFDGVDDHIDTKSLRQIKDKFSVTGWVKFVAGSSGWGGVISQINGLSGGNRLLLNGTKIRWHGQFKDSSEKWNDYRVTVPSYTNAWHHFAVTYSSNKKRFRIYFDGVKVFETTRSGNLNDGNSKGFIGKGEKGKYFMQGKVDELRIHLVELTANQISTLYSKGVIDTNILAYWPLDKDAKDYSDNAKYNGEMKNGATFSTDVP